MIDPKRLLRKQKKPSKRRAIYVSNILTHSIRYAYLSLIYLNYTKKSMKRHNNIVFRRSIICKKLNS